MSRWRSSRSRPPTSGSSLTGSKRRYDVRIHRSWVTEPIDGECRAEQRGLASLSEAGWHDAVDGDLDAGTTEIVVGDEEFAVEPGVDHGGQFAPRRAGDR